MVGICARAFMIPVPCSKIDIMNIIHRIHFLQGLSFICVSVRVRFEPPFVLLYHSMNGFCSIHAMCRDAVAFNGITTTTTTTMRRLKQKNCDGRAVRERARTPSTSAGSYSAGCMRCTGASNYTAERILPACSRC